MNRAELEKMIRDAYSARRLENSTVALSYFSEDATFRVVAGDRFGDLGKVLKGHEQVLAGLEKQFATWDWEDFLVRSIIIDDNASPARAVVHCAGTIIFSPKNLSFEAETLDMLTIEDGKIIEFVEFFDTDSVAQKIAAD